MIFGSKPRVVDAEGDNIRVGWDPTGHLDLVKFHKQTTDNGWNKSRSMQLMACIPVYIYGWMNKFHPDWLQYPEWDGSPLQKWLDTDDFGKACKVAEDHPNRTSFIIK